MPVDPCQVFLPVLARLSVYHRVCQSFIPKISSDNKRTGFRTTKEITHALMVIFQSRSSLIDAVGFVLLPPSSNSIPPPPRSCQLRPTIISASAPQAPARARHSLLPASWISSALCRASLDSPLHSRKASTSCEDDRKRWIWSVELSVASFWMKRWHAHSYFNPKSNQHQNLAFHMGRTCGP